MKSGQLLAERYRLIEPLGRGGMGHVWRADDLRLMAPVAVKLMDSEIAEVPEALARFRREAQSAAALRGPHVVQVLDHGIDDETGTPYMAMELLEGESLAERLRRLGRLSPALLATIVVQVARALTRAHGAELVHRDLKPSNIFLVDNEAEVVAKVLDFGIAKWKSPDAHAEHSTQAGSVVGTLAYMSPEQLRAAKDVDARADLWALAVIAYEALTGQRPFQGDSVPGLALRICTTRAAAPSSLAPVPLGFDEWFERATAPNIAERFQSARELSNTLHEICEGKVTASIGTPIASSVAEGDTLEYSVSDDSYASDDAESIEARPRPNAHRSLNATGVFAALGVLSLLAALFWAFAPGREVPTPRKPASKSLAEHALFPQELAETREGSRPSHDHPLAVTSGGVAPTRNPELREGHTGSPPAVSGDARTANNAPRPPQVSKTPASSAADPSAPLDPLPSTPGADSNSDVAVFPDAEKDIETKPIDPFDTY